MFWAGLAVGTLAWAGVLLPHLAAGTRHAGTGMIFIGMLLLVGANVWSLIDQRQYKARRQATEFE